MPDVFLSYSREDQPTARRFAEGLGREGFSVWWDQSLKAGEAFDKVTEQALDEAGAVVVLWSRRSVESRWVRAEATQAHANGRLVPVMIEPCRRPIMFELTHTADLAGWDGDPDDEVWRALVDDLQLLIARRHAAEPGADPALAVPVPKRGSRRRVSRLLAAALAVVSAIAGGLATWLAMNRGTAPGVGPLRVSLPFSGAPNSTPMGSTHVAIAPDGSTIAFASDKGLWIRSLRDADAVVVDLQCIDPFFSPDAAWVGCMGEPNVVKVPVTGGVATQITRSPERSLGATWGRDGVIVFATTEGLFRVAETGGKPELIVAPSHERGERFYAWPEFLPGDHRVLFTSLSSDLNAPPKIEVLDLQTRTRRVVLSGGSAARFLPTGHLLYSVAGRLHLLPFDGKNATAQGQARALPEGPVASAPDNGAADFAVSAGGTLASIAPQPVRGGGTELYWVDRNGTRTSLGMEPGRYAYPRVSPDGNRVAVEINNGRNRDLWIWDLRRASLTPLTTGPTEDMLPIWSRDSTRVFFASNRSGTIDVYSQAADGSSEARIEYTGPGTQMPQAAAPDGKQLVVYENFHDYSLFDIGTKTLKPLLRNGMEYWVSDVSRDGRWIAYESRESGDKVDIYLRPFPDMAARREKISVNGGRYPLWNPDGSGELFYLDTKGGMMSVEITLAPDLRIGRIRRLFDMQPPPPNISGRLFDISPRDGRFVVPVRREDQNFANYVTQVSLVLGRFGAGSEVRP